MGTGDKVNGMGGAYLQYYALTEWETCQPAPSCSIIPLLSLSCVESVSRSSIDAHLPLAYVSEIPAADRRDNLLVFFLEQKPEHISLSSSSWAILLVQTLLV